MKIERLYFFINEDIVQDEGHPEWFYDFKNMFFWFGSRTEIKNNLKRINPKKWVYRDLDNSISSWYHLTGYEIQSVNKAYETWLERKKK